VGDEQNRDSALLESIDQREQPLRFGCGEGSGGFIQNHHMPLSQNARAKATASPGSTPTVTPSSTSDPPKLLVMFRAETTAYDLTARRRP
jgi:hypothetical protein